MLFSFTLTPVLFRHDHGTAHASCETEHFRMLEWPLGWQISDQRRIFTGCGCSAAFDFDIFIVHGSKDYVSTERVGTPALALEALLGLVEAPLVTDGVEPCNPRGHHPRGLLLAVGSLQVGWGKTQAQSAGKTRLCWKAVRESPTNFFLLLGIGVLRNKHKKALWFQWNTTSSL